jgi:hypothetical protein
MPLRINLLAEAQALEEMRRRDPVKRAIWVGVLLGVLVFIWSGYLQSKTMIAARQLSQLESKLHSNTNEYQQVLASKKKLDDATLKLAKLQQLTTNRFLAASVLDALQHITVDDVQLTHLATLHEYVFTEEVKRKTNSDGVEIGKYKPATTIEKITLKLDAKDTSDGDQWVKFKTAVTDCQYFQTVLGKKHEVRVSGNLATALNPEGKKVATFSLECKFPDKLR